MSTVSTITQNINLLDDNFVESLGQRILYQDHAYQINLAFHDENGRADGTDKSFSLVVQSSSGEVFESAGTWTDAENGEGYIPITDAQLNFTGSDYTGLIVYNNSVCADFDLTVKAFGTPAPEAGTIIDWSTYTGYSNTATDGPYTAGTGIAFGTADGDGKVPIQFDGDASDITYDNTTSELTATDVQAAIDELDGLVDQLSGTITITVRNETGVQIDKGAVVYINGATGNRATVALADADIANTATKTIGLAFANIAHNSDGEIVVLGEITGVDTGDFEDGDQVWLSQTPGQPTNIRPTDDAAYAYRVGYVEVAGNNGKILVAPQFEGTVYGETFFAATSAAGVRTELDVPSNSQLTTALSLKQNVLSEGAFVDGDKTKLDGIESGAQVNTVDSVDGKTGAVDLSGDYLGLTAQAADVNPAGTAIAAALSAKADDNAVVKLTGAQTIAGTKTFVDTINVTSGIYPVTNGNQLLGFSGFFEFLSGAIRTLYTGTVQALSGGTLALKDNAGTTQATIDSSGLTLTTDLAVTEGGTGASTAQGAVYNLSGTRTATMTGDETLTTASEPVQFLDPGGSDRNLDLPNATTFTIKNTGDNGETITVRDASDVTIDEIDNGVTLTFIWDGSAWQVMG